MNSINLHVINPSITDVVLFILIMNKSSNLLLLCFLTLWSSPVCITGTFFIKYKMWKEITMKTSVWTKWNFTVSKVVLRSFLVKKKKEKKSKNKKHGFAYNPNVPGYKKVVDKNNIKVKKLLKLYSLNIFDHEMTIRVMMISWSNVQCV